jgi:DNA-binding transcriptional MerR regulator
VGEVARLAGVSPRTVRHYHATGLLPEPPRDAAGYRRYGSRDAIALVRAVRLRALGMPLPQVAARLAESPEGDAASLRKLADELDAEIERLTATRDRLRELAESEAFDQPVRALTRALQDAGLMDVNEELGGGPEWAAALLDAVHPDGMAGVLAQASGLLNDPAAAGEFFSLLERFRRMRPATPDAKVDRLAERVAAILARFVDGASLADADLLDKVLADRLNEAQRRFLVQLRIRLEAGA